METLLPAKENDIFYKCALVCDVELTSGKQTRVIVLFNSNELNFEEINIGLNYSFRNCYNVSKNTNTYCYIRNNKLSPVCGFDEINYNK